MPPPFGRVSWATRKFWLRWFRRIKKLWKWRWNRKKAKIESLKIKIHPLSLQPSKCFLSQIYDFSRVFFFFFFCLIWFDWNLNFNQSANSIVSSFWFTFFQSNYVIEFGRSSWAFLLESSAAFDIVNVARRDMCRNITSQFLWRHFTMFTILNFQCRCHANDLTSQ